MSHTTQSAQIHADTRYDTDRYIHLLYVWLACFACLAAYSSMYTASKRDLIHSQATLLSRIIFLSLRFKPKPFEFLWSASLPYILPITMQGCQSEHLDWLSVSKASAPKILKWPQLYSLRFPLCIISVLEHK